MKLTPIVADTWMMDGGVAFGVVPKSLWSRVYPEERDNLIRIVTRCLLIQTANRNILIDTGMGDKRGEKYYTYKYRFGGSGMVEPLAEAGLSPADITDVVFTHLHDDHVGGATFINERGEVEELFKNATYRISATHWEWAKNSNKREAAAYFSDNLDPIGDSGRLLLIEEEGEWLDGISFRFYHGHTRGQMVPFIKTGDTTFVYTADFIPSRVHIPIPYVPAVDVEPLLSMAEKESFLKEALDNDYILLFEHDYFNEGCRLSYTGGRIVAGEAFKFKTE